MTDPTAALTQLSTGTSHNELLAVAILLAMWLLLRVRRQDEEKRRPTRKSAANMQELGMLVFQAARSSDLETYRGLFLSGAEASLVYGAQTERYLEQRSRAVLQGSLQGIRALLPEGSRYDGVEQVGQDAWAIWVTPLVGERTQVGIGTAVRVGAFYRLKDPAFADAGEVPMDPPAPMALAAGG